MNDNNELINDAFTYLAFDYGAKKIGVAVGQSITLDARPLKILYAKHGSLASQVKNIIDEWNPNIIIVGYPYAKQQNEIMKNIDKFYNKLKRQYKDKIGIVKFSEELSTEESMLLNRELKRDGIYKKINNDVDDIAASLILLSWFRENMIK